MWNLLKVSEKQIMRMDSVANVLKQQILPAFLSTEYKLNIALKIKTIDLVLASAAHRLKLEQNNWSFIFIIKTKLSTLSITPKFLKKEMEF